LQDLELVTSGPEICLTHRPLLSGFAHLNQALLAVLLQGFSTLMQPGYLGISNLQSHGRLVNAADDTVS